MYGPPSMRQEVPLLAEQGVQVTSARFVVYQQTYPIAGITSVAPFSVPSSNTGPGCLIAFAALFCIAPLVRLLWDGDVKAGALVLFPGSLLALGVWWFRSRKPSYGVVIWTAGANVRALTSQDGMFVQRVIGALNQAIASR